MENDLFVYGTLMTGMANHSLLAGAVADCQPAAVYGTLYHLRYGYPALLLGGDRLVRGEVLRLRDIAALLPALDELEGYWQPGHPANLYERVACNAVLVGGRTMTAITYIWSHPGVLAVIGTPVEDGCWRNWQERKVN